MAAQAGSRDRGRRFGEAGGTRHHGFGSDFLYEVSAIQVAGSAITQIARESDFLVIGGPQNVRVREVFTTMGAVDLPGEVDALSRSAIRQSGIMAEGALLS